MQHDQPVDHADLDRPLRLFAEDRDIVGAGRPGHHPLRSGHQRHDPARLVQIGSQKRGGKAEARHRVALGGLPEAQQLVAEIADRLTAPKT